MIQSPLDLAEELAAAVRPRSASESVATQPKLVAFVSPPLAAFIVTTVEGRAYRVTVTEEEQ